MIKRIFSKFNYYLRLAFVWLVIFEVYRVVFITRYRGYLSDVTFFEFVGVFWQGIRIDFSTIGYILGLTFLFYEISKYLGETTFIIFKKFIFGLNILLAFIFLLICGGEIGTYGEWEGKLSAKVLTHLVNPSEVMSTASTSDSIAFVFFITGLMWFFIKLYQKLVYENEIFRVRNVLKNVLFFPLIGGVIFLFIRGGWQQIPIQLSNAYYTNNQFLNDVSVNAAWAFGNSLDKRKKGFDGNPFEFIDKSEAQSIVEDLYKHEKNEAPKILKTEKPNVVFVILESWSADIIETLDGYEGVSPNFNELTESGLLFTDFYGAGWTSDQAMSAMYSSAVVYPNFSIINDPEVFRGLPAITDELHGAGYNSSYFFGGDLDYGNIKAYLLSKNFQKVKDEDIYDSEFPRGSLGVQDEFMFNQYINEINELEEPFFTNLFTVSTHSPYDFPSHHPIDWGGDEKDFLNSIFYADSCLGDFFAKAKKQDWYQNTLFVVIADHSHVSPKKWRVCSKEKSHVPLLLFGEVLKDEFKGTKINKIGNHLDIPSTLLYQLGMDATPYKYSKNLLDTTSLGFASFTFHNGFGWINPKGSFGYTFNYNKVICTEDKTSASTQLKIEKEGNAFFQTSFEDFY